MDTNIHESGSGKKAIRNRRWELTPEEIAALPNTRRELSEAEIAAAKELYFAYKPSERSLMVRAMIENGWTEFRLSELVGNHRRGMKGLAPGLGWDKELRALEEAARAAETIETRQSADGSEQSKTEVHSTTLPAEASGTPPNQGGELLRMSFPDWLKEREPNWDWDLPYQRYIYKALNRIATGRSKRLMIFLPPRHGKSELVTVRFAGWMLCRRPETRIIVGSYNQKLANRFSRKIRRVLLSQEFEKEVPRGGLLKTADDWETATGGGVKAVGVGAGVTGFGADLIIVDDPIKSRAEANSENNRERVSEWFNDDLHTRLEPNGSIILIQTRWHEDDLAGRLLKEAEEGGEQWEVIRLPALAEKCLPAKEHENTRKEEKLSATNGHESTRMEKKVLATKRWRCDEGENGGLCLPPRPRSADTPPNQGGEPLEPAKEREETQMENQENVTTEHTENTDKRTAHSLRLRVSAVKAFRDVIGRKPGEALCPARFSREELLKKKAKMGSSSFEALYQQNPVPLEGGLFKRDWLRKIVDRAPDGLWWYRAYDLAVSTKTSADYTASFRVALDRKTGFLYIADGFRKRIEYPEQRRYVVGRIRQEKRTEHGIEEALHGQAFVQDLRRDEGLSGHVFRGVKPQGDKYTRALAWAARAEEGKVVLVRGAWIDEFLDEACRFPNGAHDDQVDAVSLAVQMIERRKRTVYGI